MSSASPVLPSNVIAFPARQSWGKRTDLCSGKSFDVNRFYADFPDRWMAFCQAEFPGPVAVASHFDITERAAEKWLGGIGGPRGDKAVFALITVPGAARALLGCDLAKIGRAA